MPFIVLYILQPRLVIGAFNNIFPRETTFKFIGNFKTSFFGRLILILGFIRIKVVLFLRTPILELFCFQFWP